MRFYRGELSQATGRPLAPFDRGARESGSMGYPFGTLARRLFASKKDYISSGVVPKGYPLLERTFERQN